MTTANGADGAGEFEREERFIVIKRKHLDGNKETWLRSQLEQHGIGTVECVVVESDWPEYEAVWKMIEDRCAHRPTQARDTDTELLDRAEKAWQRFFYPANDCFTGDLGDRLPAVDLEVADCLRLGPWL